MPSRSAPALMIRLLIVADIRLYQEGLAQILARERRLQVVATAADAGTAIQLAAERVIDVALVDMAMAESVASMRAIAAQVPRVKVVAVGLRESGHDLVLCAEAGIAGYVPRAASIADLVAVLESVGRGELLCSPGTAAALLRRVAALAAERGVAPPRSAASAATLRSKAAAVPGEHNNSPRPTDSSTATRSAMDAARGTYPAIPASAQSTRSCPLSRKPTATTLTRGTWAAMARIAA